MNRYLFVIDYQNDFVDGALGFPGAEKLDEKGIFLLIQYSESYDGNRVNVMHQKLRILKKD